MTLPLNKSNISGISSNGNNNKSADGKITPKLNTS